MDFAVFKTDDVHYLDWSAQLTRAKCHIKSIFPFKRFNVLPSLSGMRGRPFCTQKKFKYPSVETLTVKQLFGTTEVAGTSLQLINVNQKVTVRSTFWLCENETDEDETSSNVDARSCESQNVSLRSLKKMRAIPADCLLTTVLGVVFNSPQCNYILR